MHNPYFDLENTAFLGPAAIVNRGFHAI